MSNGIGNPMSGRFRNFKRQVDQLIHPGKINLLLAMSARCPGKQNSALQRACLRVSEIISMRRINIRAMRTRRARAPTVDIADDE